MHTLDWQVSYWDSVADKKTFSHTIQMDRFRALVGPQDRILDYGCGYGRTCAFLQDHGYTDVTGVEISKEMIQRGNRTYEGLHLLHLEDPRLPFADNHFAACTLLAVLTCVPTDTGQKTMIHELLTGFEILNEETIDILTMNGNDAKIFQFIAKKP